MGKVNISFHVYSQISYSWIIEMIAHITQRNDIISIIFQELLESNKPCNGLLRHDDFFLTTKRWCHMTHGNAEARGCEKQIVNPKKARNATKDKVQLSTPPVKASYSPPFCHPFTTQNQANLLVAGDFLDCSYVMDWCATAQGIKLPSVCVKLGHIKKKKSCIVQSCIFIPKKLVILSFFLLLK